MDFEKKLQNIYDMIPTMNCKEGCHECCGPISWSPVEDMVIQKYMKKHNIKDIHWNTEQYIENKLLCPYMRVDGCIIYPVRPIICRLQGHVPKLPCPHRKDFDICKQKEDIIKRKYNQLNLDYLN